MDRLAPSLDNIVERKVKADVLHFLCGADLDIDWRVKFQSPKHEGFVDYIETSFSDLVEKMQPYPHLFPVDVLTVAGLAEWHQPAREALPR